jgi:hypothetical protein
MIDQMYKYEIRVELQDQYDRDALQPFAVNHITTDQLYFVGELASPLPIPGCSTSRVYSLKIIWTADGGLFCLILDCGDGAPIKVFNYPFVLF